MGQHRHHRVLVVEDDREVREAVTALLEVYGHAVVEAPNGREALRFLQSPDASFCLIVLDLFMPEMDGWTFRAEQRKDPRLAPIPVILVSADPAAISEALEPGVVAAMVKPIDFDRLLELVAKHC
jgi:CheY-like chemotaxis protein